MEEELEALRQQYFQTILFLEEKEDIKSALPAPEYKNFIPLIVGIIQILEQESDKNKKSRAEETSEEMLEYFDMEIKSLEEKIAICNDLLKVTQKEIEIQEENDNNKKSIIFASTNADNIYFERDLKGIPKEYYQSIENCLKSIENNIQEDNVEKAKTFTNNVKLAGIHEVKDFQTRVLYKILDKDTVYVMQVRIKKDNNSLQDREEIITRAQQTDKEYKKIKSEIKDELKKLHLIEHHKEIRDKIMNSLSSEIGETNYEK